MKNWKQFAVLVDSLDPSQMIYEIINGLNGFQEEKTDPILFFHRQGILLKENMFSMMYDCELLGYMNPVISTCLKSTERLLNCPTPSRKLFYVWNLEWLYEKYDFDYLNSIYNNKELELIARSKEHAETINNCWKKPKYILERFDNESLNKII